MFRSLRARLVLVMMLLIILMMVVVGAFLVNSVAAYQVNAFRGQMNEAFSSETFVNALRLSASVDDPPAALNELLREYSGLLGINNVQRNFYILDAQSGALLTGSDNNRSIDLTPTIAAVMADNSILSVSRNVGDAYMDAAVQIKGVKGDYIIYVKDTKEDLQDLINQLVPIIATALLIGVALAIVLSLLLSKAITTPLERLTHGAQRIASGTFTDGLSVESDDEIGVLTSTFNHMARELKQTLEEIGSERDKLGTLFLHMTDGVASFTREGVPVQANPSAERLLGCHFPEMLSFEKMLGSIVSLKEILSLKEKPRFIQRECERGGRRLLISLAPFGHDTTEGVMAVLHDVTEQYRLDELRREFVSNVSHELRTPLTNIRSYAETLLVTENLPQEMTRSFTQVILNEAERMTRIVHDLLNLSRFDYGKLDWRVTQFSLEEMLRDVHEAMWFEAERLGHTLSLLFGATPLLISGDRERLEQVVVNVLSNAMKYTPSGGNIEVTAGINGDHVRIVVKDNGIGIPKENLPRLFDRFFRVDKARSRSSGGTGLGLSIAKEIVERHHGSIDIGSVLNEGTTVTISLPTEQKP